MSGNAPFFKPFFADFSIKNGGIKPSWVGWYSPFSPLNKGALVSYLARAGWKPKVSLSLGQAKRRPRLSSVRIFTPWKGKSVKTSKYGTILKFYEIEYNDEYVFKDERFCPFRA